MHLGTFIFRVRPRGICLGGKNAFLRHNFRWMPPEYRKFNVIDGVVGRETRCVCFILLGYASYVYATVCAKPEERESRNQQTEREREIERERGRKHSNMRRPHTHTYKTRLCPWEPFPAAPFPHFPHCRHSKFISCVQLSIVSRRFSRFSPRLFQPNPPFSGSA